MSVELKALQYDPFEGDFGDPADKTLSDKIVHARTEHKCFWCGNTIKLKEAHRSRVDIIDGELRSYRWCIDCCLAMVSDLKSGTYNATKKRISLNTRASGEEGK